MLTPTELAVAALLVDGCSMALIAELFGITRQAAQARLDRARQRILTLRPDLARRWVTGRYHPTRR